MFDKVFVETGIKDWPRAQEIIKKIKGAELVEIDRYDQYFGKRKKPFLHRRQSLNLYLAEKRGELVKETPDAYGHGGGQHYYFVHAYNCIYECQYCYLQGHFSSPDLVLFLNWEDIFTKITKTIEENPVRPLWFHAGEFSDSLALSHISGEIPALFNFFSKLPPDVKLEMRTKSVNIRQILQELNPSPNIIISMSLGADIYHKEVELGVPTPRMRIAAMNKLQSKGHNVAIHLDPIIMADNWEVHYRDLFGQIKSQLQISELAYLSLGVVRFPEKVFKEVQNNYPTSSLLRQEFVVGLDGKRKYPRPLRAHFLKTIKSMALEVGFNQPQIYFCMEDLC